VFSNDGIMVRSQPFEGGAKARLSAIAHCNGYISQKSGIPGAGDRARVKYRAEFGFADFGEAFEWRRERARLKCDTVRNGRTPVPGADVLADVAAENMLSAAAALLFRYGPAQFDGEVRDAQAGIDGVAERAGNDGGGRASLDTTAAGAAAIRRGRIGVDVE
jgi:hypothetical protein